MAESGSHHGGDVPFAREDLETLVAALPDHGILRLVIIARMLLDETRRMLEPGERALHARAELKAIVAALPAEEVARLLAFGRDVSEQGCSRGRS